MKLTNDEIRYINRWLQFSGINYLDVRYELVDHLITEFEHLEDDTSLETFVKERLAWCKLTAKKKEKAMHWGIQRALWKRFLSLFLDLRIIVPLLIYVLLILFSADLFTTRTARFLFFAPVFVTIAMFIYQLIFKNFGREKQKQVLAMTKLGGLFALPQLFLSLFFDPSIWGKNIGTIMDSPYFMLPCVVLMTFINIAAILEYVGRYEKIEDEYQIIKGVLL